MSQVEWYNPLETQIPQQESAWDILSLEDNLSSINEKYWNRAENFDVFENYMTNLDSALQESIMDIMNSDDKRTQMNLKRFIKRNGFPTEVTIEKFLKKFKIENNKKVESELKEEKRDTLEETVKEEEKTLKEEEKKVKKEGKRVKEEEEKAKKEEDELKEIREKEKENIDSKNAIKTFKEAQEISTILMKNNADWYEWVNEWISITNKMQLSLGDSEKFEQLSNDLKELTEDPKKLWELLLAVAEKSGGTDTEAFKVFEKRMVAFNPATKIFFEKFKSNYPESKIAPSPLNKIQQPLHGEWTNYKKYGHMVIGDEGDYDAFIDVADIPPSRTIGLKDSSYKLETGMPVLNLKGPIYRYEKAMMIADKDMKKVKWELNRIQVRGREAWETFKETQNTLRHDPEGKGGLLEELFNEQKAELDDIKTEIENKQLEIAAVDERKKVIKEIYQKEMNAEKGAYAKELKKHDEKTKKVLEYLHDIWFDDVPQALTDRLIEHLNGNSSLRAQLGFNEEIDLEEGNLGIDTNAGDTFLDADDRVAFGKFFMKAIGAPKGIVNLNNIKNNSGVAIPDRAIFKTYLNNSWIMWDAGFGLMLENLKKDEAIHINDTDTDGDVTTAEYVPETKAGKDTETISF